jgi:hypothetical protein
MNNAQYILTSYNSEYAVALRSPKLAFGQLRIFAKRYTKETSCNKTDGIDQVIFHDILHSSLGEPVHSNDRKSYTGAQVLRWVHEEKLTG